MKALFIISGNKIVVAKQFDFEKQRAVSVFTVFARDQYGLEARATVRLTIRDINDNTPVFRRQFYSTAVKGMLTVFQHTSYRICSLFVIRDWEVSGHDFSRNDIAACSIFFPWEIPNGSPLFPECGMWVVFWGFFVLKYNAHFAHFIS